MHITAGCEPADVDTVLATLPQWFGIPAANAEYVGAARRLPGATARSEDGTVLGVVLWERHFAETWEVHLIAVTPDEHRHGIGRGLVGHVETLARADGARLLEVKTLGASSPDESYARTRRFYLALGFLPLEELLELWGEHPCLIMVKPLR